MKHLKELHEKLAEYNSRNSTIWAILFCTNSLDEVFIVSEEDNQLSPDWWPCNHTGETIEKALELVPKEKKCKVVVHEGPHTRWSNWVGEETKEKIMKLMEQ